MNAVIMDDAVIGAESIIGALAFVKEGSEIPDRSIAVGNPAKVVKEVTDEMAAWKTQGTKLYQSLPMQLHESLKETEPLRSVPENRPAIDMDYQSWRKSKG